MLVQFVEMFLKKFVPSLYEALGIYLPLITTNCAVLGVALLNVTSDYNVLEGIVNGFATAVGFTVAIVILAGIREKTEYNDFPESFKGMPMVLLTSARMAMSMPSLPPTVTIICFAGSYLRSNLRNRYLAISRRSSIRPALEVYFVKPFSSA